MEIPLLARVRFQHEAELLEITPLFLRFRSSSGNELLLKIEIP
jgi:hypothetical protein